MRAIIILCLSLSVLAGIPEQLHRMELMSRQVKCPDGTGKSVSDCLAHNPTCKSARYLNDRLATLVSRHDDNGSVLRALFRPEAADHSSQHSRHVHGLDLSGLSKKDRESFVDAASETPCTGDHDLTLLACRNQGRPCEAGDGDLRQILANFNPVAARRMADRQPIRRTGDLNAKLAARREVAMPLLGSAASGSVNAPVTLVVFGDFQCPFSRETANRVKKLQREYGKQLRVVYKHFPLSFHDQAVSAAYLVETARETGSFTAIHDALYEEQHLLGSDLFQRLLPSFKQASQKVQKRVAQDVALAQSLGLRGTPACFLNGRPLQGLQSLNTFRALIDQELSWVQKGNRPSFTSISRVSSEM